jgi:hypothetical protein
LKEDDADAFFVVGGQRCFLLQIEIAPAYGDHRLSLALSGARPLTIAAVTSFLDARFRNEAPRCA